MIADDVTAVSPRKAECLNAGGESDRTRAPVLSTIRGVIPFVGDGPSYFGISKSYRWFATAIRARDTVPRPPTVGRREEMSTDQTSDAVLFVGEEDVSLVSRFVGKHCPEIPALASVFGFCNRDSLDAAGEGTYRVSDVWSWKMKSLDVALCIATEPADINTQCAFHGGLPCLACVLGMLNVITRCCLNTDCR